MTGGHQARWLPLGLAGLIALLSFWLNQLAQRPEVLDNAGFAHDPDYIVKDFRALSFDTEGRPRHQISAASMSHFMDDDTSEMAQPRFRFTLAGRAPIEVSARRGVIIGDRDSVHFLGNVRATRVATAGQAAFTLSGEHLRVVPDAGILSSDTPVTLRQGKSIIQAGGLLVDEHKQRLELTGGVRGLYESKH